jgi:hypothetical protein
MLKKNDGLLFTPSAVLNFGSYNINVTHKTNAPLLLNRLIKKGKLPEFVTNNFQAESMGLNWICITASVIFHFRRRYTSTIIYTKYLQTGLHNPIILQLLIFFNADLTKYY